MSRSDASAGTVWIIVLNWNGHRDTIECVESCRRLQHASYRIVVVDNGSIDGSEGVLRGRWTDVDFLQTGANLGYSGGNNAGIRHALAHGAAYIWLLNNDARVAPDALTYMVDVLDRQPAVGIVGAKVYYLDRPEVILSAGGAVDLERGGAVRHIGGERNDDGAYDAPAAVDWVAGCSMMVRREVFASIGPFDDNYFLYFEDVDLCLRARAAGWTVTYEPRARIWHREGAKHQGLFSSTFIYYFLRNRLYFMKRFAPGRMWRCHWRQFELIVFLLLKAAARRPAALGEIIALAVRSYLDFYVHRAMGRERRGRIPAARLASAGPGQRGGPDP